MGQRAIVLRSQLGLTWQEKKKNCPQKFINFFQIFSKIFLEISPMYSQNFTGPSKILLRKVPQENPLTAPL